MSNNNTNDDEERQLMASLHIENMANYEANVVQQAERDLAPSLSGKGFPALRGLAPSGNPTSHVQEAQTLLGRLRNSLNEKDLWKQQLLLHFLQEASGESDMEYWIQPQKELKLDYKRRQAFLKKQPTQQQHQQNEETSTTTAITDKNGVSTLLGTRRRRISMQQRKQELSSQPTEQDDDDEIDKERLRAIRQQRDRRRNKRKLKFQQRQQEESSDEEEFQFDESPKPQKQTKPKAKKKKRRKKTLVSANQVLCPLCQTSFSIPKAGNGDEFLSQHMTVCQTTRRSRRGTKVSYQESVQEEEESVASDSSSDSEALLPNQDEEDEALIVDDDETIEPKPKRISKTKRKYTPMIKKEKQPLDDWYEEEYEDRVEDWIESGVEQMKDMKERDAAEQPPGAAKLDGGLTVPAWINDRLFPYQRTGVEWMFELHQQQAGGIVGDEMGLGKTVQIAAFLGSMASSRKLKSILIISPATMLQHWLSEMAIWAPGIRRILIHSSADQHEFSNVSRKISPSMLRGANDWLQKARSQRLFEPIDSLDLQERDPNSFCGTAYAFVTTYENVRRNSEVWINHKWSYVIIDEAQKIRNPDADITLVLKRIRSPHRLALSGTPIQNDLKELWSLFDFVFPGRLGTLPSFLQEFGDPIKRGGYSNASPMQVQVAYRCALILKDLIHPYLLRRLKNNIMEVNRMPTKTEQVLFCRLTNRQRILYESFLQSDLVKNVLRGNAQLLGAITVLRKICNHPDLVCSPNKSSTDLFLQTGYCNDQGDDNSSDDELQEEESLTERSGKLQVLAKILPLWKKQGHRVLIFCQWKKMLNLIQTFFVRQGWKFGRLDGNTCIASRQKLVDKFNADDSYFAMLCTTRTGGVGLNLTGADRIILYDPDWNPQTDAQARERAWRFGQERPVTIFRLISAGTVEEKIYQRQIFKTALSNKVLQDAQQRRLFSQRDLKDLFSLKADGGSVISGGDGLTETGELTKGDGYVDPDYDENTNTNKNVDDGETMRTVLKSKGLAGVFDHGVVENPDHAKKASVREMEARAKIIAKEAQSALEQSVSHSATSSSGRFTPTWTGNNYNGNNQGRFGSSSAGVARNTPKSSSGALLAAHRQRQQQIQDPNQRVTTKNDAKQYTVLLEKIRGYIKAQAPTTHEILDAFQDAVGKKDAAIFRRLLKSVAVFHNPDGRWRLRSK